MKILLPYKLAPLWFTALFVFAYSTSIKCYSQSNTATQTQAYLKNITIKGNDICKRSIILRELNFTENTSLSKDSLTQILNLNRLRLENLALFNEVVLEPTFTATDTFNLCISVKERWYIIPEASFQLADRNFNQWWVEQHHDFNRINLVLAAVDKNFRGTREELSIYTQFGYTQKYALNYIRPYLNKAQTIGWGLYVSYATNRQIYYSADSNKQVFAGTYTGPILNHLFEGTLSLSYRPAFAVRHLFSLSYKFQDAADTILILNADYFGNHQKVFKYLELAYRLEMNHTDNWNYPTKGKKLVINNICRFGITGFSWQNYINVEAGAFKHLSDKFLLAAVLRGRLTIPNNQPFILTEGLGFMANYLRGYEYYIINGSQYGLLRLDLKYELLNHTFKNIPIKYFTAFPVRIYPKIYIDAGYCSVNNGNHYNNFLGNTLLASAGIGIDIVTAYDFKIRLEYTLNALLQKGLYLHTTSE
jgi:outer membrane protein assembly factor BamA